ncbi:MAG: ABC transporter substrate-binding protein [Chloroflexota bacterium]
MTVGRMPRAWRVGIPLAALITVSSVTGPHSSWAQPSDSSGVIKIGVLTTLQGPFVVPGQDGFRGVQAAFKEVGYKIGGKRIQLVEEGTDATVATSRSKVAKLVEQNGVQIEIGPLSGDEGLYGVKPYAKSHPHITFVNGTSAAEDTTLRAPAKNFFRFTTDGTQWMAGLGEYAYGSKHYRKMAVVAEDYSFPYSQVAGFMLGFCRSGGHVVHKNWVPLGTKDYSSVVTTIPKDVDAIYVALGGADALNFLKSYIQFGGKAPIVGGSITVDQTVISAQGTLQNRMIGTPAAGPTADDNPSPAWKHWVNEYDRLPGHLNGPGLFSTGYYIEAKAVIKALQKVHGDLSGGERKFQNALAHLRFSTPTGQVHLDQNRNAVADMFLTEVVKKSDGTLFNKLIKVVHNVNQTLGIPRKQFLKMGEFNRDNPSCP